jgi:hypothetical protein
VSLSLQLTDINNPSVPENLLIPDTFDSTNTNMGNFSNVSSAISPTNAENNQSTLNIQNVIPNSNSEEHTQNNTVNPVSETTYNNK